MKRVTIKDIARVANVSYATVSRALSDNPEISEATRSRIKKLCHEMGYTPNVMARSLVTRSTNTLGIIVPDVSNPFFSEIVLYMERFAGLHGYSSIICNSWRDLETEKKDLELLFSKQIDGLIFSPFSADSSEFVNDYAKKVPTVIVSDNFTGENLSRVRIDNFMGAYNGTRHLISLGHKNITLLGVRDSSLTHKNRKHGFLAASSEYNIESDIVFSTFNSSSIEAGYELSKKYFKSHAELPSAVFAINDLGALGVLQAADELGISVPEELSVLGFDNIVFSALPKIMLTTIANPISELCRAAIDLLLNMINGSQTEPTDICIMPKLVIRNSCAAVKE